MWSLCLEGITAVVCVACAPGQTRQALSCTPGAQGRTSKQEKPSAQGTFFSFQRGTLFVRLEVQSCHPPPCLPPVTTVPSPAQFALLHTGTASTHLCWKHGGQRPLGQHDALLFDHLRQHLVVAQRPDHGVLVEHDDLARTDEHKRRSLGELAVAAANGPAQRPMETQR